MQRTLATVLGYIRQGVAIPESIINEDFIIEKDFGRNLQIMNITFKKIVVINSLTTEFDLSFVNCVFEAPITLQKNCNLKEFGFIDCRINSDLLVYDVTAKKFEIGGCFLKHGLYCSNLNSDFLRLDLVKTDSAKINFYKPHLSKCRIFGISDNTRIIFSSYDEKVTSDDTSFIGQLNINAEANFSGELLFYSLSIDSINLAGYNKDGRLNFQKITIGSISYIQFINFGFMSISSVKPKLPAVIYLLDSNLGGCHLFDINFSAFTSVTLVNSNIQDVVPTNVIWCKEVQSSLVKNFSTDLHLRESYRQLKNVMIRSNDKIEELKYHALEMDTYYSFIKKSKGNFAEKFIIWTNKVSNNHGLSWLKAFYLILFFSLLSFNLNKILLGYNSFEINLFWKDVANWLQSINPVRKFTDVYTTDYDNGWKSNLALFIDVISRVLYSYLIFQFISAFRKYVKK